MYVCLRPTVQSSWIRLNHGYLTAGRNTKTKHLNGEQRLFCTAETSFGQPDGTAGESLNAFLQSRPPDPEHAGHPLSTEVNVVGRRLEL